MSLVNYKIFRNFVKSSSGTAAIEFALVALPLFILILGTFEISRVYWTTTVINDMAQIGARCLSVDEDNCSEDNNAKTYIQEKASDRGIGLNLDDIQISRISSNCSGSDIFVEVQISITVDTVIGYRFPLTANACHVLQPAAAG